MRNFLLNEWQASPIDFLASPRSPSALEDYFGGSPAGASSARVLFDNLSSLGVVIPAAGV